MQIKDFIKTFKNNGLSYAVIKNWSQPTPTREKLSEFYKESNPDGRISIKDKELTKTMIKFLNECLEVYPNKNYELFVISATGFRNQNKYLNEDTGTSAHNDPYDILHWQCRGATYWHLGKNAKVEWGKDQELIKVEIENPEIILLEPGDLLWMQAETWHKTENITEKYSLIFGAASQ